MNRTPCPSALPLLRQRSATVFALPIVAILAACNGPLDYDLRGQIGAFNTTNAAQTATENRPTPDARGLITYSTYQVAVAQRGDTVATVSERINLPVNEIARLNGVQPSDTLRKGEVLVLPRRAPDASPTATVASTIPANPGGVDIATLAGSAIDQSSTTSANPGSVTTIELKEGPKPKVRQPVVQDGPEPVQHRVTRGETAYTIARLYQVPVKSLGQWNGLDATLSVREGQLLLIPLKEDTATSTTPTAELVTTAPGEGSPTPTPPSATNPLPDEVVIPTVPASAPVKVEEPTRTSQSAMTYPVQGKIIRAYSKGKSDGIDIAATAGGPVKAAESGSVAAITKDSNGVPFLVIRHDTGLLTVYSNVDGIRVRQGERVDRGQTLAVVRKESSGQAYVHFQIRDGLESVDPLPYLQ